MFGGRLGIYASSFKPFDFGKALDFNRSGYAITAAPIAVPFAVGDFTYATWVRVFDYEATYLASDAANSNTEIRIASDSILRVSDTSTSLNFNFNPGAMPLGSRVFVVVTVTGGQARAYVNAVESFSGAQAIGAFEINQFGRISSGLKRMNALMINTALWNYKALDQSEIDRLYRSGNGADFAIFVPTANYNFENNPTDRSVTDISGNGFELTLIDYNANVNLFPQNDETTEDRYYRRIQVTDRTPYEKLILNLQGGGSTPNSEDVFTDIDYLNVLPVQAQDTSRYSIKDSDKNVGQLSGTTTHSYRGLVGDGSTGFLETGILLSDIDAVNNAFGHGTFKQATVNNSVNLGAASGLRAFISGFLNGVNNEFFNARTTTPLSTTSLTGGFISSRNGNDQELFVDGSSVATGTIAAEAFSTDAKLLGLAQGNFNDVVSRWTDAGINYLLKANATFTATKAQDFDYSITIFRAEIQTGSVFTNLALARQYVNSGVPYRFTDSDAEAIAFKMGNAGSPPTVARCQIIEQTVIDLKGTGTTGSENVWADLDSFQIIGANSEQTFVEWKGSHSPTPLGALGVSVPDVYTAIQAANQLDFGIKPSEGTNYTLTSASIHIVQQDAVGANQYLVGVTGSSNAYIRQSNPAANIDQAINNATNIQLPLASDNNNLVSVQRNGGTVETWTDGTLTGSAAKAATSLDSTYTFRTGINRATPLVSSYRWRGFVMAGYLNAAKMTQLNATINKYLTAIAP